MKTAKLVIGIISMVLFVLVAFQSCAAGLGNALADNGEVSGTSGMLLASPLSAKAFSQVEIYDQVWFVREGDSGNHHSGKATALVQEMCSWLMEHPGCGETFPMDQYAP